jgi:hypothetical protein
MRSRSIFGLAVTVFSALALAASAGAAGTDTRTPFTDLLSNPCTGEEFIASGFVHTTSDFTFDLDGSIHVRDHVNMEGMTAKALVSGVKYVVQEEENLGTNASDDHMTIHHISKLHFVRAREDDIPNLGGDDFYLYFHLHLTVNGNGTPTAMTMNTSEDTCQ